MFHIIHPASWHMLAHVGTCWHQTWCQLPATKGFLSPIGGARQQRPLRRSSPQTRECRTRRERWWFASHWFVSAAPHNSTISISINFIWSHRQGMKSTAKECLIWCSPPSPQSTVIVGRHIWSTMVAPRTTMLRVDCSLTNQYEPMSLVSYKRRPTI